MPRRPPNDTPRHPCRAWARTSIALGLVLGMGLLLTTAAHGVWTGPKSVLLVDPLFDTGNEDAELKVLWREHRGGTSNTVDVQWIVPSLAEVNVLTFDEPTVLYYFHDQLALPEWARRRVESLNIPADRHRQMKRVALFAVGWPCRAASCAWLFDYSARKAARTEFDIARITKLGGRTIDLVLPIRVSWPGLAANILVLSIGGTAVPLAYYLALYRLRRMRGQCGWCAYPNAAGTERCSECGVTRQCKRSVTGR